MKQEPAITFLGRPDTEFDSQYGMVTYLDWCKFEIERAKKKGDEWIIVEEPTPYGFTLIALDRVVK